MEFFGVAVVANPRMALYVYFAACAAILLAVWARYSQRRSKLPLPPGPKKLPVLGNLLDMPKTFEWETYMKWAQTYSQIHPPPTYETLTIR